MEYESIKSFFNVKQQNRDSCMAICPSHDDKQASLSISYDRIKSKTLIYCHAGCDTNDILSRMGLKMQDLFDGNMGNMGGRKNIEAVYKYTDSEGNALFEKVRFRPKSFSQRRYIDGKVVWGLDAGMYYETYPGSDEVGRCHMENIAKELSGSVKSIKIVELPVPHKEDVSWYLEEGHTLEELMNLVKNTQYMKQLPEEKSVSLLSQMMSDVGNAERIIALQGGNIRYDCTREKFFIWSGSRWKIDTSNSIYKLAKSTLRSIMAEAESLDTKGDTALEDMKNKFKAFAVRSENDSRIRAMVNQLKSQPEIMLDEWDSDLYLLNLKNGTLDLRTGRLQDHCKSDYITRIIDLEYDQKADCPRWQEFLNKVFMGDFDTLDFVQKSIGYSLTGSQKEQCFYMLHGNGANGKTTFLNTIKMIMGEYSDSLKASSLMSRQFDDGARGDLAKLQVKRFVCASELNEGQYFDESLLKCLTGGESIPVRFLYGEEFNLKPRFKIWLCSNERPRIRGSDLGIWRRVRLIPFLYTFTEKERDKDFFEQQILPELPGILNWAVEGCLKWQEEGIKIPGKSLAETEEYRDEMDIVQRFLDESCIMGDIYTIKVGDMYRRFCTWCSKSGDRTISSVKFGKKLKEKGFEQYKSNCWRHWKGIGVTSFR